MATEETSNPPPPQPSPAALPLPQYPEMIIAAIEALNDKNGSNKSAIARYIESTYTDLPAAHSTLLSHHLNKLKQSGQLVLLKNNYMKPDPNAPPKRGRGRPPKPKAQLPPGAAMSPPRPRGRPPKPRDPFAPPPLPKAKSPSSGTGRPRGRPPKKAKTATASAPSAAPAGGAPRGRGRPPKVKPAVAPVGC
ncbi:HMG-Y-related protein B-like [Alnus glutinosa]|uniref:HMG-Y-related protein B-like n=1 Tax=Alnus glutinosa TaxID=3517 RepID=UPI002D76FE8E|nr:HMG-Y-related protein B-like [Alnus glutinosa]